MDLSLTEEELATISVDCGLQIKHNKVSIDQFRISIKEKYPSISSKAKNILLQFCTSYLCELGFCALTNIKCKNRSNIKCIDEDMRVFLTHTKPYIQKIAKARQAQVSHKHT